MPGTVLAGERSAGEIRKIAAGLNQVAQGP
jgi:hypothetical protein